MALPPVDPERVHWKPVFASSDTGLLKKSYFLDGFPSFNRSQGL
jgi:hypothetical protein